MEASVQTAKIFLMVSGIVENFVKHTRLVLSAAPDMVPASDNPFYPRPQQGLPASIICMRSPSHGIRGMRTYAHATPSRRPVVRSACGATER